MSTKLLVLLEEKRIKNLLKFHSPNSVKVVENTNYVIQHDPIVPSAKTEIGKLLEELDNG